MNVRSCTRLIIAFAVLLCSGLPSFAQDNVGIGTLTPDQTALLELLSKDKGFLPPRLSTLERDNIINPATGLIIFNTTDSTVQYFNGICWLNTAQTNCNDCSFTLTGTSIGDTIDRVVADSVAFQLTINQNTGAPQNVALSIQGQLPLGTTVSFNPNPVFGSGTTDEVIRVTPFTPSGTHPIVIQVTCGTTTYNYIYALTLDPCYEVHANNSATNYDLSVDLYITHPGAPTNQPVCVVSYVDPGVEITSPNAQNPAYTTGNLPAGSVVAIVNNGNIIGKGGNGGIATDPANGWTGEGFDGGDAIDLTANTSVLNNFNIYGGGGGGNAMAFGLTFQLPAGLPAIGILIGAGGGGGAGGGLGGNIPSLLGLTFYSAGQDATAGQFGVPGDGGLLIVPISIQQGPVDISINPNVFGGDGGNYGAPGTQGAFQVTLSISVIINIPFVGNVTIPVLTNFNVPIPVPVPNAGDGGFAIKRNGNTCNIPDNNYSTSFLKGRVGN